METNSVAFNCVSCGNPAGGNYCANCGEKKISEHDFELSHIVEESVEGFTHFDNKFLRSVKLLVGKPGMLTVYFSQGRRIPYMKPLQLFIVCNLLFFLFYGKANIYALTLYSYDNYQPFINFGTHDLIKQKAPDKEQFTALSEVFNERMYTQSKAFIIFFIPLFALTFAVFFFKKKRYFSEHLVFASHYFSFLLLLYLFFHFVVDIPYYAITKNNYSSTYDFLVSFFNIGVGCIYFNLAAQRFYQVSPATSRTFAVVTVLFYVLFLYAYRILLFFKIFHSIH